MAKIESEQINIIMDNGIKAIKYYLPRFIRWYVFYREIDNIRIEYRKYPNKKWCYSVFGVNDWTEMNDDPDCEIQYKKLIREKKLERLVK